MDQDANARSAHALTPDRRLPQPRPTPVVTPPPTTQPPLPPSNQPNAGHMAVTHHLNPHPLPIPPQICEVQYAAQTGSLEVKSRFYFTRSPYTQLRSGAAPAPNKSPSMSLRVLGSSKSFLRRPHQHAVMRCCSCQPLALLRTLATESCRQHKHRSRSPQLYHSARSFGSGDLGLRWVCPGLPLLFPDPPSPKRVFVGSSCP